MVCALSINRSIDDMFSMVFFFSQSALQGCFFISLKVNWATWVPNICDISFNGLSEVWGELRMHIPSTMSNLLLSVSSLRSWNRHRHLFFFCHPDCVVNYNLIPLFVSPNSLFPLFSISRGTIPSFCTWNEISRWIEYFCTIWWHT